MKLKRLLAVFGLCLCSCNLSNNNDYNANAFDIVGLQYYHEQIELDYVDLPNKIDIRARLTCDFVDYYGMIFEYRYNGSQFYYDLRFYNDTTYSINSATLVWSTSYLNNGLYGWLSNNYRFIEVIDNTGGVITNLNNLGYVQMNYQLINGYFTFNNYLTFNGMSTNESIYISYSTNGHYYQELSISSYGISYNGSYFYTFDTHNWSSPYYRLLYFERGYISDSDYYVLDSYGEFTFIDVAPDYTFSDMIFSFIDIPIYLLSSLLSWELFGLNLFVALGSLLLVLLVFKVIKLFI